MRQLKMTEMRAVLFAMLGVSAIDAWAVVFSCIDKHGIERREDRYIAQCADREQKILNPDGSTKATIGPTLTPEQLEKREEEERKRKREEKARKDADKSDRDLVKRYPNEQAHNAKRATALQDVQRALKNSGERLEDLSAERKLLLQEAEFYRGRTMPAKLKDKFADNDAAIAAQRDVIQTQRAEQQRINKTFDAERDQLRKLWNGEKPSSLGPALR
jgi:hypothetical protein